MKRFLQGFALVAVGLSLIWAQPAAAQIRGGLGGYTTLAANDDGSSTIQNIGFTINFFGVNYSSLYVNNNGNVTFNAPLSLYTPSALSLAGTPILAPFLADVDTRGTDGNGAGNSLVGWGSRTGAFGIPTVNSPAGLRHDMFAVNWVDVGFFSQQVSPLNRFQLVIIDRGDVAAGDFDFEFNYSQVLWDAGQASGGGSDGVCIDKNNCSPARVAWSNGSGGSMWELAGSGVSGALLDGGSNALISGQRTPPGFAGNTQDIAGNVTTLNGRYLFAVRNGQVTGVVPEPMTFVLMGTGLIGIGLVQIRRRRQTDEV
jgi:hypothetical protein